MGDEWPVAALFWLDHTRDAAASWLNAGLDGARAEPVVSALLATNLILLVLWMSTLSRVRAADGEVKAGQATIAELLDACEKERKWRLASARVDAQAQPSGPAMKEHGPITTGAPSLGDTIPVRETSPQTIAAA